MMVSRCIFGLVLLLCCWWIDSTVYKVELLKKRHPLYSWENVVVSVLKQAEHERIWSEQSKHLSMVGRPISNVTSFELLVSMTSVSFRIDDAWKSIYSILNGSLLPSKIYLFLSRTAHLHDKGVSVDSIPENLLVLAAKGLLNIVYTDNIGPHRKLLPLLASRFNDPNVLIVTIDDDISYGVNSTLIYQLFNTFVAVNGSAVVAARSRSIGLCKGNSSFYVPYHIWGINTKESGRYSETLEQRFELFF